MHPGVYKTVTLGKLSMWHTENFFRVIYALSFMKTATQWVTEINQILLPTQVLVFHQNLNVHKSITLDQRFLYEEIKE